MRTPASPLPPLFLLLVSAAVVTVIAMPGPEGAAPAADPAVLAEAVAVASGGALEYRGQARLATGHRFADTEVGGLSALAWDPDRNLFYALSDDRSERAPARFYTLEIALADGLLTAEDLRFTGVTTLRDEGGEPFPPGGIDPEGIAFAGSTTSGSTTSGSTTSGSTTSGSTTSGSTTPGGGTLFVSSEGDSRNLLAPFVREMGTDGSFRRGLEVPAPYLPVAGKKWGVRNNLGFEALTFLPGAGPSRPPLLFAATESALAQDGPGPSLDAASPARILRFDAASGVLTGEFLYRVDPVAVPSPVPGGFLSRGLTELVALSPESFLGLERSFSLGAGFTIRLYRISLTGADNLLGRESLAGLGEGVRGAEKSLLLDFGAAGLPLDNFEGLAFGPILPGGRQSLLVVADNNFSGDEATWFLLFALAPESP